MRVARELTISQIEDLVDGLQLLLYTERWKVEPTWNPDKVWDANVLMELSTLMDENDLIPDKSMRGRLA